jgi:hypothetical protein
MSGSTHGPEQDHELGGGISDGDGDAAAHMEAEAAAQQTVAASIDPSGRAALLLVESLLHALVARRILKVGEAIDIIDIAADVEAELAGASDDERQSGETFLSPLARTFRIERGE